MTHRNNRLADALNAATQARAWEEHMNEDATTPQTSRLLVDVTVGRSSPAAESGASPAVRSSPSTYEVMRIFEAAQQDPMVRLFLYPNGVACACGHTSCAGSG